MIFIAIELNLIDLFASESFGGSKKNYLYQKLFTSDCITLESKKVDF